MPKLSNLLALLVLCTGFALTGCDSSDPEDENPSIGGTYTDTASSQGVTVNITLDIDDTTGGSVDLTGSASIEDGDSQIVQNFQGTGTYDYPDLSLNITTEVDGETESDQLTGTVSSSGNILTLQDSEGFEYSLTRD